MADSSRDPAMPQRPGTPRWVKAIGVLLVAMAVIALVVMIVGGGQHGPARHTVTENGGPFGSHEVGHDQAGMRRLPTVG